MIIVQKISRLKNIPSETLIKQWVIHALQKKKLINTATITIRIINKTESAALNYQYRHKTGPTNVLSFVYNHSPVTGDIVLCAPLIKNWPYLIIHGVLHLRGFDHIHDKDAFKMEALETKLLTQLGFE